MPVLIFLSSILAITVVFWFLNKWLSFKICPICAGVSLTWLWIVAGITAGYLDAENFKQIAAIAMGGTVVGIAYQGERRYPDLAKNIFYFKVPVILLGFLFVWWAINNIGWLSLAIEFAILAAVTYLYFISPAIKLKQATDPQRLAELKKKLEECCN